MAEVADANGDGEDQIFGEPTAAMEAMMKRMNDPLVKQSDMDQEMRMEALDAIVGAVEKFPESVEHPTCVAGRRCSPHLWLHTPSCAAVQPPPVNSMNNCRRISTGRHELEGPVYL